MPDQYQPTNVEKVFELLDQKLVTFGIPGALSALGMTKFHGGEVKAGVACLAGAAGTWLGIKVGKKLSPKIDELLDWLINDSPGAMYRLGSQLRSDFEGEYLRQQAKLCEEFTSEGFNPDRTAIPLLEEVFVPLDLSGAFGRELEADEELASDNLDIWKLLKRSRKDRKFRKMMILAKGGMGKTTLLRHIALIYGQRKQRRHRAPKLIPVLLRLRDWREELTQPEPPGLVQLIQEHYVPGLSQSQPLEPPARWAEQLLAGDSALIMLDGFDEIADKQRPQVSQWISSQMREYDGAIFILTSRPAGYKDYAARKPAVPIFVNKFTVEQQNNFVQRWYLCQEQCVRSRKQRRKAKEVAQERSRQLLTQLEERRAELGYMAENPLLLNLLVTFHRFDVTKTLPQQRIGLYRGICKLQLDERPRARGIQMLLPFNKSERVLQELALGLTKLHQQTVKQKALLNFLAGNSQLKTEEVDAAEFLKQIVDVSELLVEREPEEYEFPHLSFQGFFAASQLAAVETKEEIQSNARLVLKNWNEAVWRETVLLFSAQLTPRLLEQVIRKACKINPEAAELATLCLKEYPRPEKFMDRLQQLFASLNRLAQDSKYFELENQLKAQKWKVADKETYRLMITAVGKEEGQIFSTRHLQDLPCEDLRTIDQLWTKYSDGRYGFSVQKKIWESVGSSDPEFYEAVGWHLNRLDWAKERAGFYPFEVAVLNGLDTQQRHALGIHIWPISSLANRLTHCDSQVF